MKYEWNPEKNDWLKRERRISFEEIIFHLAQGDVWKTADHPNQEKYPGQRIYFVIVDDYIYLVPYVPGEPTIFLKTIIPSRKATRDYLAERPCSLTRLRNKRSMKSRLLQRTLSRRISASRYVFMNMISLGYKRRHWREAFPTRPLSPVSFIVMWKATWWNVLDNFARHSLNLHPQ